MSDYLVCLVRSVWFTHGRFNVDLHSLISNDTEKNIRKLLTAHVITESVWRHRGGGGATSTSAASRLILFVLGGPRLQEVHVQLDLYRGGLVVRRGRLRYDLHDRRRRGWRGGDVDARTGGNNVTRPPRRGDDAALFRHLCRRRACGGGLVVDLWTRMLLVLVL